MAGFTIIERQVGERRNLINGQEVTMQLPRDFTYAGLLLRLSGALTVAGGTTNGTLNDENPMSYLDEIVIEATGGRAPLILKRLKGRHAFRLRHLIGGREPTALPIGSAAVQTATAFSAMVPIDFALPGSNMPPELAVLTVLNPREFDTVTLRVRSGDTSSFINGGDRTITVVNPVLDVYAQQAINVVYPAGARAMRYVEEFRFRESHAALATLRTLGGQNNSFPLGKRYRYVLLTATDEGSNKRQPIDDLLGEVQLWIGNSMIYRYNFPEEIWQRHEETVRVQDAINTGGLNALSTRANPVIGYTLLDFLKDGRMTGVLDTTRFQARGASLELKHDIETASARQLDVTIGHLQ